MACFKPICYNFVVLILLLLPVSVMAQTAQQPKPVKNADLPYFEGFENQTTSADWQLNVVKGRSQAVQNAQRRQLGDKWYFSTKEHYQGNKCMLISDTVSKGTAAVYQKERNVVVAYREFELMAGDYNLDFAWRCRGEHKRNYTDNKNQPQTDDNEQFGDGFYVLWLPASDNLVSSKNSVESLPELRKITQAQKVMKGDDRMFRDSQFWLRHATTLNVPSSGKYRLYFIWNNDGDDYWRVGAPSACVDNIQLDTVQPKCATPTAVDTVKIDGRDVTIKWSCSGTPLEYEVSYRPYGESITSYVAPNVKGNINSVTIRDMKEGLYNFFVRAICGPGDTSAYAVSEEILVFDRNAPGRCIPFDELDRYDCGWMQRHTSGTAWKDQSNFMKDDIKKGGWNKGSESVESKHTVHNHPGEVDGRAGGLSTIPPGEVMSVRLGSWETGGNIQYIEYDYMIQPNVTQILYLNYAVVLEAPFDPTHFNNNDKDDMSMMPMFTMEVLDENGRALGGDCGFTEYFATPGAEGWTEVVYNDAGDKLVYRDWTKAAVNLSKFKNTGLNVLKPRPITIRFTTHDCILNGHFAYAYFTLRCEEMKGEGLMCGNEPTAKLEAPDGFKYEWYLPSNTTYGTPNEKPDGTERTFIVNKPELHKKYKCVLISTEKPGCEDIVEYEFYPRQPRSKFLVTHAPRECKNIYRFKDVSSVVEGEKDLQTGEKPTYYEWDFGDGTPVRYDMADVEHEFPATGGTFKVSLLTAINDNSCTHKFDTTITVPNINVAPVVIDTTICSGKPFVYKRDPQKKEYFASDTIEYLFINNAGCEERATVHLTVIDSLVHNLYDTICQGYPYEKNGYKLSKPLSNKYRKQLRSQAGCDSVVYLHLHVIDSIRYEGQVPVICGDDKTFEIPYTLLAGEASDCVVEFDQKAKDAGFPASVKQDLTTGKLVIDLPSGVRPDHYSAVVKFSTDKCDSYKVPFNFTVNYPVSVVQQKWNDVLALKNAQHNGGNYTFSAYQWYKNGQPIAGATSSYIYIGQTGAEFDAADVYTVSLVREGEAVQIPTCPIVPVKREPLTEFIGLQSAASVGQRIAVSGVDNDVEVQWYGMDGRLVSVQRVVDGELTAPSTPGIYMLRFLMPDDVRTFKVVVK